MGYPHPDYWLEELTGKQLTEWEAYYSLEPFGELQEWERTGLLASMIANLFRGKDNKAAQPVDFIPSRLLGRFAGKKQSVETQKTVLSAAFGSKGMSKREIIRRRRAIRNRALNKGQRPIAKEVKKKNGC